MPSGIAFIAFERQPLSILHLHTKIHVPVPKLVFPIYCMSISKHVYHLHMKFENIIGCPPIKQTLPVAFLSTTAIGGYCGLSREYVMNTCPS